MSRHMKNKLKVYNLYIRKYRYENNISKINYSKKNVLFISTRLVHVIIQRCYYTFKNSINLRSLKACQYLLLHEFYL